MNNRSVNLSIIVPVYNEEKTILEILSKLSKLKKYCKLEIIIVNDGSTDGTTEIIKQYKNVVYFLHDHDLVPKRKISDGIRQFLLDPENFYFLL